MFAPVLHGLPFQEKASFLTAIATIIQRRDVHKTSKVAFYIDASLSLHGGADGNILATHSVSAGLDYPSIGPEHAWLASKGRSEYAWIDDREVSPLTRTFEAMIRSVVRRDMDVSIGAVSTVPTQEDLEGFALPAVQPLRVPALTKTRAR